MDEKQRNKEKMATYYSAQYRRLTESQVDAAEAFWFLQFQKLAKQLGCLASTVIEEAANDHVFDRADIVMRHWHQSVELAFDSGYLLENESHKVHWMRGDATLVSDPFDSVDSAMKYAEFRIKEGCREACVFRVRTFSNKRGESHSVTSLLQTLAA